MKKLLIISLILLSTLQAGIRTDSSLNFATDYVYRGVSVSNNMPVIQGGLNARFGNAYMGMLGSNYYHEDPQASSEFQPYAGLAGYLFAGYGFNLGYLATYYPDASSLDREEVMLSLNKNYWGLLNVNLNGFYDSKLDMPSNIILKTNMNFSWISINMSVGRDVIHGLNYSSVSLAKKLTYRMYLSVSYENSYDFHTWDHKGKELIVGSLSTAF